jgi:hypothetical protein
MADPGQFAEFERDGEDTVIDNLVAGRYTSKQAVLAQAWLQRAAAKEVRKQRTKVRANRIAIVALVIAILSAIGTAVNSVYLVFFR